MAFMALEKLSVDLRNFILEDINMQLDKYDYMCIIGPTGAGKTVLLETIAGFYRPKTGKIMLDDVDITYLPPESRGVSIVYQDYMLFPHMTVYENIAYGIKKKIHDEREIRKQVSSIAEILGISHLLDRKPVTLSGGEQQRVAFARAVLVRPKILLMDEPFSALDTRTREKLRNYVKRVVDEFGLTVIHVTHDFMDVWTLTNKAAIMNRGRIVQMGRVEDIFSCPTNKFVADFVDVNIIEGLIEEAKSDHLVVRALGKKLLVRKTKAVYSFSKRRVNLYIRPEDIILSKQPTNKGSNTFKAKILSVEFYGPIAYVYLEINGVMLKSLLTKGLAKAINNCDEVYILIEPSSIRMSLE